MQEAPPAPAHSGRESLDGGLRFAVVATPAFATSHSLSVRIVGSHDPPDTARKLDENIQVLDWKVMGCKVNTRCEQSATQKKAWTMCCNRVQNIKDAIGEDKLGIFMRSMAVCTLPAFYMLGQLRSPNDPQAWIWGERCCRELSLIANGRVAEAAEGERAAKRRAATANALGQAGENAKRDRGCGDGDADGQDSWSAAGTRGRLGGDTLAPRATSCRNSQQRTLIACRRSTAQPAGTSSTNPTTTTRGSTIRRGLEAHPISSVASRPPRQKKTRPQKQTRAGYCSQSGTNCQELPIARAGSRHMVGPPLPCPLGCQRTSKKRRREQALPEEHSRSHTFVDKLMVTDGSAMPER